jgi:hypothetical protein
MQAEAVALQLHTVRIQLVGVGQRWLGKRRALDDRVLRVAGHPDGDPDRRRPTRLRPPYVGVVGIRYSLAV